MSKRVVATEKHPKLGNRAEPLPNPPGWGGNSGFVDGDPALPIPLKRDPSTAPIRLPPCLGRAGMGFLGLMLLTSGQLYLRNQRAHLAQTPHTDAGRHRRGSTGGDAPARHIGKWQLVVQGVEQPCQECIAHAD